MITVSPVILCGGSGTRFWPLSRGDYPKQFLSFFGKNSLFQNTLKRALSLKCPDYKIDKIIIISNEKHRFLLRENIEDLLSKNKSKIKIEIILEPSARNTAPALTLAALSAFESNPNSLLVVMPSDHLIKKEHVFKNKIIHAILSLKKSEIITFGVKPSCPDTNFGYIHYSGKSTIKKVIDFKEKPDILNAKKMFKNNHFAWNSGIFIMLAETWLTAISLSNRNSYKNIYSSFLEREYDLEFVRPNKEYFNKAKKISIDYAVMDHFDSLDLKVNVIIIDIGWSDLGNFTALDNFLKKDKNSNAIKGEVIAYNSNSNIAVSSKRPLTMVGVSNLIVIETSDAILVADKSKAHEIKGLVDLLNEKKSKVLTEYSRVYRPWGFYDIIDEGDGFKVKKITVKPKSQLSYQLHKFRNEHWVVVKGLATINIEGKVSQLKMNQSTYISSGLKHQLINNEVDNLEVIEVQTGKKLIESDIIRFNDLYGRT